MWQAIKSIPDKGLWAVLIVVVGVMIALHHHPEAALQNDISAIRADLDRISTMLEVGR